jgi:hypothetical protein
MDDYATRREFRKLQESLGELEEKIGKIPPFLKPKEKEKEREVRKPMLEPERSEEETRVTSEEINHFSYLWIPALILFGFGDTLTSYLVFAAGGREANPVLGAMIPDGGMLSFVVIKTLILVGLLVISYFILPKRQGWVVPSILTLVGTFLVAYNMVSLFTLI